MFIFFINVNINNTVYNYSTPHLCFAGRKDKSKTTAIHQECSLPKIFLVSAGMFLGANYTASKIYDSLDTADRVESEHTSFSSAEDAYEYAKTKVVGALNSDSPYEHMVYIDNKNNILGEFKGHSGGVYGSLKFYDLLKMKLPSCEYISIHGHPAHGEYSTPISFSDFEIFNNESSLSEVIALNSKGEYSKLSKKDGFKSLDENVLNDFKHKLWDELQSGASAEDNDSVCAYQQTLPGIKTIHRFWVDNADKLNLNYETNYSYLK